MTRVERVGLRGHIPCEPFLQTKLVDQSIHEDVRLQNGCHGLYREWKVRVWLMYVEEGREGERRGEGSCRGERKERDYGRKRNCMII